MNILTKANGSIKKLMKLYLITALSVLASSLSLNVFSMATDDDSMAEKTVQRSVKGDYVSFDENSRMLVTSVGIYKVGSAIGITDVRNQDAQKNNDGQVALYFNGDQLIRVVIY